VATSSSTTTAARHDSSAPYFAGIVRIGEFDGDMNALRRQGDHLSVTVDRAR
jgi:hypothetical protein